MTYAVPPGSSIADWVRHLLDAEGTAHKFYLTRQWRAKRAEVIARGHGECADCRGKSPAVYSPATCVHHVQHLDRRPDLALSDTYVDGEGRVRAQLVPLCSECHDVRHGRFGGRAARFDQLNDEKW